MQQPSVAHLSHCQGIKAQCAEVLSLLLLIINQRAATQVSYLNISSNVLCAQNLLISKYLTYIYKYLPETIIKIEQENEEKKKKRKKKGRYSENCVVLILFLDIIITAIIFR